MQQQGHPLPYLLIDAAGFEGGWDEVPQQPWQMAESLFLGDLAIELRDVAPYLVQVKDWSEETLAVVQDLVQRQLAHELGSWGITVNMIAPGWIPVERHADYPAEQKQAYAANVPAGRMGTPQDVAPAVVYLASDEAAMVNGHTLCVDGGWTAW